MRALEAPESPLSSAVFRIGFGIAGVVLVVRFFVHGWIDTLYLTPEFHFTYPGLDWVQVWPSWGMYAHFAAMGIAAFGIALGYRYRLSVAVFAVLLAYVELIDRSLYLNHYYWLAITAVLMLFLPLHRAWSLDVRAGRVEGGDVAASTVWILRFQVGMVYFFAGMAKLNPDWLFEGQPLATWLPARSDMPLIGPLLALSVTPILFAWTAALFDLTIVGWLMWRRSRPYAYIALVAFHAMTWVLFPRIGLFPLIMTGAALIFLNPDWPRKLGVSFGDAGRFGDAVSFGDIGRPQSVRSRRWTKRLAAVYLAVMVLVPLRHLTIPGDVHTTGEGYLGSWHVMLVEKTGSVRFEVTDAATENSWTVGPPEQLTTQQLMVLPTDPVMLRQAADLVAEEYGGASVKPTVRLSINGRPSTPLATPELRPLLP